MQPAAYPLRWLFSLFFSSVVSWKAFQCVFFPYSWSPLIFPFVNIDVFLHVLVKMIKIKETYTDAIIVALCFLFFEAYNDCDNCSFSGYKIEWRHSFNEPAPFTPFNTDCNMQQNLEASALKYFPNSFVKFQLKSSASAHQSHFLLIIVTFKNVLQLS